MGRVFVEDWAAWLRSPYLVVPDDAEPAARLVEDGDAFCVHSPQPEVVLDRPVAFVDGVRRVDASLYQENTATGLLARGIAGSHACGAVLIEHGERAAFAREQVSHMVIWGSAMTGTLPSLGAGWNWQSACVDSDEPDAPLAELQQRMRLAEGRLAEQLCEDGYLTIVDGPLSYVRSRDVPVVGYVKTHSRPLLDLASHRRVPELTAGQRTSLFSLGVDRYSAYLRIAPINPSSGPWAGVVRLEVPQAAGLDAAVDAVDAMAATIPRYAGIAHRDPRAPQNLQPVGALEKHLRHLLGDSGLARRAVRESVAALAAIALAGP
ncbi:MAG TPA: hypothetical protein VIJ15_01615 [Dermatophilaceae bacterium]